MKSSGGVCERAGSGPRVVVGVDGSTDSMRALAWAAAEARLRDAVLDVVHVDCFRHELFGGDVILGSERTILDRAVASAKELAPDSLWRAGCVNRRRQRRWWRPVSMPKYWWWGLEA